MKQYLQQKIERWLARLAKKIIAKYNPQVIGITGSIGKTSTKEAIAHVLSATGKRVRQNIKNYNNEIGLPLTIIGATAPGRSLTGWLGVWWKGRRLLTQTDPTYPEILVLEMGIDRPGDMDKLVAIVKPTIAVLTSIGRSHLEFFGKQEDLALEKRKLVNAVPDDGWVILNHDDKLSLETRDKTKAHVLTYGFSANADYQASDLTPITKSVVQDPEDLLLAKGGFILGANFKVQHAGKTIPFYLHRVLGRHQVLPILPAIAVGELFGMNILAVAQQLQTYRPPKGRMNLVAGLKETLIIDDTYNAAPESTIAALKTLRDLKGGRKVAILGDMLELGSETEQGHRQVGEVVAQCVDLLVTFGPRASFIADEAVRRGLGPEKIHVVQDEHRTIEEIVQNWLKPGDIILIKGSQSARMEMVVKMLMAEPLKAGELLVRQEPDWLAKPYKPLSL